MADHTTEAYPAVSKEGGGRDVFGQLWQAGLTEGSMPNLTLIEPKTNNAIFNEHGYESTASIRTILDDNNVPNTPISINNTVPVNVATITIYSLIGNSLSLSLPKDGEFKISIFSLNGKSLFTNNIIGSRGINSIKLPSLSVANQVVSIKVEGYGVSISKSIVVK